MAQFRYQKRRFLAPVSSLTTSYIVAEVESSYGGAYELGTNTLTIADCHRRVEIEFFLGSRRDRQQSLAKAQLLADIINRFCENLRDEANLIEKMNSKPRKHSTKKR